MTLGFGDCEIDLERRELWRAKRAVHVEPQVFDLLVYLVQNRDRVVSKDDLIASVWGGRIVSESTLTSRINAARNAVGDSGRKQQLIRTIPRKGLRFIGAVQTQVDDNTPNQATDPPPDEIRDVSRPALLLPDRPAIAVLPFTNMSGDPEQEYFSDGITEDIITALSRLHWFFVIARNSTFAYKGKPVDVKHLGRELGVRYVLEGSVRKSGRRVRITSQLIDATTNNHIWAERYDRELSDIFALQDEITASVIAAIEPKLLAAEGIRAESRSIEDLNAWDLVARAVSHFWKLTAAESATAIAMLRQAVQRYPDYAPAHSILAFALVVSAHLGWTASANDRTFAAECALRAAELDDQDPWAHVALGYLAFTARRTDEAIDCFRRALDLNPNFAVARGYIGFALACDGRSEDAIENLQRAIRMSPRDPLNSFFFVGGLAAAHYHAGRYAEAVDWARQQVQLRPGSPSGHRILCASLAQAGLIEEARAAMRLLRQVQPNISVAWIKASVPYPDHTMPRFLEGLRKAGLTD